MEFTIADTLKKARLNCELSRISPSADAYRITQDGSAKPRRAACCRVHRDFYSKISALKRLNNFFFGATHTRQSFC